MRARERSRIASGSSGFRRQMLQVAVAPECALGISRLLPVHTRGARFSAVELELQEGAFYHKLRLLR